MTEIDEEKIKTENNDSFVLVKPGHDGIIEEILDIIRKSGLSITSVDSRRISRTQAEKVYEQHRGRPFFEALINLTMGEAILIRVCHHGEDAIQIVRESVIPEIRNLFQVKDSRGVNKLQDCAHAPDSEAAYIREAKILDLL